MCNCIIRYVEPQRNKSIPILVKYFDIKSDIRVKILNVQSIEGETSEIKLNDVFRVISENNLNIQILALSAGYTNTNFGNF